MTTTPEEFFAALSRFSREQVHQAGQRYTPGVDPKAPNLRIASLFAAIENVACGAAAQARFQSLLDDLSEAWRRAKHCSQQQEEIQSRINETRTALAIAMPRFRAQDSTAADEWLGRLSAIEIALKGDAAHWRGEEAKLTFAQDEARYSAERNAIQGNLNSIGRCLDILEAEAEYSASPAFKVLSDPGLLLTGEWGTGKTHLLCDVTQDRIRRGQPTLLILAKNFQGRVLDDICGRIEAGMSRHVLFDRLQLAAVRYGERSVVVVDGVNEGRRQEWRAAVSAIRELITTRPGIALIVTCRTPFEKFAIAADDRSHLHEIQHVGFDDQEFDAQAAFFQYYELPLPEVPLLDREFSRPLTLKLICQSLKELTGRKLAKDFAGIASGQKGMTFVLESFVNRVGAPIEKEFGLKLKGCWWLLKGSNQIIDKKRAGFASCMATSWRGFVRPSEADRIIAANYQAFTPARRRQLLESLRTSGLLEEDTVWYWSRNQVKSRIVYRLPYQRFSDHLIARHLLEHYLDVSSIATIKQSFSPKSPLGRIFTSERFYPGRYSEPGLAQALITEFPTRAGSRIPSKQRELVFALPNSAQNISAYFEPFVEGLFWRDPASFTDGTARVINRYVKSQGAVWDRIIDGLAAISTKPKHPYHARRLYDYIARFTMPNRDAKWSEYLRRHHASPTIHRLLTWSKRLNIAEMTESAAEQLIVLLSLVFTTVVRDDRDIATKALVLIGEKYPHVVFKHVLTTLSFNDPYVSERTLAAAYGVTMSLVDGEMSKSFRKILGNFAYTLYRKMFAPGTPHGTHHCLSRDYAHGIIELALRANCVRLPNSANRNLAVPYPQIKSVFSEIEVTEQSVAAAIGHAIHMDFGNYTIGRLIPNRANYDNKNPEYVRVRARIEQRIYDLGYRNTQFESIEQQIQGTSFGSRNEQKVDRYGKKYSWIAYFEMWGEREARNLLPEWRLRERTSDCGVDPSFPRRPPAWSPPIPELFGEPTNSTDEWVGGSFRPNWNDMLVVPDINQHPGPWVLLEAFIRGEDHAHGRELFAFLRGVFVRRKDIPRLRAKFLGIDYPGNEAIPEGATENYLYAGEAGRRDSYARDLLMPNGKYRRQVRQAFDRYVTIKPVRSKRARKTEILRILLPDQKEELSFEFPPTQRRRRIPGIRLELPSINFGWESYHSTENEFSNFYLPAPSLIQRLGLASRNREIDFYETSGAPGIVYREAGAGWKGNLHRLLYVRADLLRRYLAPTGEALAWCNWGERDWLTKMDDVSILENPGRQRIVQEHKHIHRSFARWSG